MSKDYSKILETIAKNNCQDAINSIAIEISEYPQIVELEGSLGELKEAVNAVCKVVGLISPYNVLRGAANKNPTEDIPEAPNETEEAART